MGAVQAARIPPGTDLSLVSPILCAGITVYKGLKNAQCKAGDIVAISGAGGGLGSLAIQYAKAIAKDVIEMTNGGPHGVINVSVSELAMQQSANYVRANGTVVLIGLPQGAKMTAPV